MFTTTDTTLSSAQSPFESLKSGSPPLPATGTLYSPSEVAVWNSLRPNGSTSLATLRVSRMRVGVTSWYSPPAPKASPAASIVRPPPGPATAATTATMAIIDVVTAARATTRTTRRLRLTGADRNRFVISRPVGERGVDLVFGHQCLEALELVIRQ